MASRSHKTARDSRSARLSSGAKPKQQGSSQSQPIVEQPELEQATAELATAELQSSRPGVLLTQWVLCSALAVMAIIGGIGIYLYRGIQTYRYYDWTILPVSDTRLEAACGELTVYYMSWQNPKAEKPIGHVIDSAERSQCVASKQTPTPASRFTGLGNKAVLNQLGCKPEGGSIEKAVAWDCTKPVGKLLRAEIEAASQPKQR